jgi:hypothetical protein
VGVQNGKCEYRNDVLLLYNNSYMIPKNYKKLVYLVAHLSLFIVFFWFGAIKLIGASPANELVEALRIITISWWPFSTFIVFLGLWEMLIGVLMLFKKTERIGIYLLIPHMITTGIKRNYRSPHIVKC